VSDEICTGSDVDVYKVYVWGTWDGQEELESIHEGHDRESYLISKEAYRVTHTWAGYMIQVSGTWERDMKM
jgi:hypothetical protein